MTIVEYRARRRYHNTKYEGFDCPLIRYKESGLRLCLVYQNWLVVHSYGLGYYYYYYLLPRRCTESYDSRRLLLWVDLRRRLILFPLRRVILFTQIFHLI